LIKINEITTSSFVSGNENIHIATDQCGGKGVLLGDSAKVSQRLFRNTAMAMAASRILIPTVQNENENMTSIKGGGKEGGKGLGGVAGPK
jgi:hypothetical protein